MADQDNGGYMNYGDDGGSDFKRKTDSKKDIRVSDDEDDGGKMSGKGNEYFVKELLSERVQMDGKYPHADRLLQQELATARQNGKMPHRDLRYVDIYNEKPIKVTVKVLVPIKEHPKFNFVGKLLGPKGNSLRRLQEDTLCKMAVMGRGSMKDRNREENFRQSLDPKYGHLNDDLHVEISALAPAAEAHARIAYALAEVRKYLTPDSNDEIRQEQFRELVADGVLPPATAADDEEDYYRGRPPPPPPPPQSSSGYSKRSRELPHRSRSPVGRIPGKKVLSMLHRARTAMDDRFLSNHEDYDLPHYERGSGYHQDLEQQSHSRSRSRPEPPPPPMEYRRDYYRDTSPAPPPAPYVKSSSEHQHSHRSSTASSSSWRSAGGGGSGGYSSASRSHPPAPADDHYASRHPAHRAYQPERSYRGSPYLRPPK